MTSAPNTTLRQARIATAFSAKTLEPLAHRWAEIVTAQMASMQAAEGNVLNWSPPADAVVAADAWLDRFSENIDLPAAPHATDFIDRLRDHFSQLAEAVLANSQNLHDPRYIGHQVPASVPIAALFDALGSMTNQAMAIYEMGPWATAVERAMIDRIGTMIGLSPGTFSGLITHGGSLANLTALLTARNVVLGDVWETGMSRPSPTPVLVVQADAHYCISRAAGILGLGTQQVIRAPLDDRRRMDVRQLDELLTRLRSEQRPIIAVCACACATPIGAFDPLMEIADVCVKHGVWMHVDAAHGGAAAFSDRYRHLIEGLARADSFICDAHKTMFVPALCAFVFYRDKQHRRRTFSQDASYLYDPSAPDLAEYDSGLMTIECTKRAAAYGLWGLWSLFGPQLFADMVDTTFDLGRSLYEMLEQASDFETLHEPQCNIVVFRHIPPALQDASAEEIGRFNRELRRRVMESGDYYIVQTSLDDIAALRAVVMNPLTTEQHLQGLLETLRTHAQAMLSIDAP